MKTAQVSTLDRPRSAGADLAGSQSSCGAEPRFGDAVITDPRSKKNGSSSGVSVAPSSGEGPIAARIRNFPIPQATRKRRSFKETDHWEGLVTQVSQKGIVSTLSRRYQDFPAEEALIPWDEIDPADRDLAQEGSTFHWKVGYLEIDGQRLSVSHIEFRRIPNFSSREQSVAKAKAAEYASLFDS